MNGPLWEHFDKMQKQYKKLMQEETRESDYHYWKGKMEAYKHARDHVGRSQ